MSDAGHPRGSDRVRRIAIVDDDTVIRLGTPLLLDAVELVGVFAGVEDLLAARPPAEVVLLDLGLSGLSGLSGGAAGGVLHGAQAVARASEAGYRVLVYTNERRRMVLAASLAAGALGLVHKTEPMDVVRDAIGTVADGGQLITTAVAGLAEIVERHGELPTLTPRQREVLALRARGVAYTRIGRRLGISARTAEEHMRDVSRKFTDYLRTHSPADLERYLGLDSAELY